MLQNRPQIQRIQRSCASRYALVALLAGWQLMTCIVPIVALDTRPETLARRREQIMNLTSTQRAELTRKYSAYQQLSQSERDQLRSLHDRLEGDPELRTVMQHYCEWLKRLDVTQRQQLREARTPEQKRSLVVAFQQAQRQSRDELWREVNPGPLENRLLSPLSSEQLAAVMTSLESELGQAGLLTPDQKLELQQLQGSQRYRRIVQAIGEFRHPPNGGTRVFAIPAATWKALEQTVGANELPPRFRAMMRNPDAHPNLPRMFYLGLYFSMMDAARREFTSDDAEHLKENVFQAMTPEAQAELAQLSPRQQDFELVRQYRDLVWKEFVAAADDLPQLPPGARPVGLRMREAALRRSQLNGPLSGRGAATEKRE